MKRQSLSYMSLLGAVGVLLALYAFNVTFRQEEGRAKAAVSGGAFADVEDLADYPSAAKRILRQKIRSNPAALHDLSGLDIQAVLNAPEMIRRDGPTEVWQYRNAACVLDLYFTPGKKKTMKSPVVHYEVRPRDRAFSDAGVTDGCVSNMVRAHAGYNLIRFDRFYKSH